MQRLRRPDARRRPRSPGAPLPGLSVLRRLAVVGLASLAVGTVGITASSPLHGREAARPASSLPAGRPDRGEPDGGPRSAGLDRPADRDLPGGVPPHGIRPGQTRPNGAGASFGPEATSITLVAVGEIDLSRTVDPRVALVALRGYGTAADLALCRLAAPLPASPDAPAGRDAPDGRPEGGDAAAALADAGFDRCDTDGIDPPGSAAAQRTRTALDRAGIAVSVPSDGGTRTPIATETVRGTRIALLSYLDSAATTATAGLTAEQIGRDAARARADGADLVVAQLAWGRPGQQTVTPHQRDLARALLTSSDVDLILGSGGGSPLPIERIAGRYVAYDLGTLIATQAAGGRTSAIGVGSADGGGSAAPGRDGVVLTIQVRSTALGWTVAGLTYTPTWTDPSGAAGWPIADRLDDRGTPAPDRALLNASWQRTVAALGALGSTDGVRVDRVPRDPPPDRPGGPAQPPESGQADGVDPRG
ncbi:CapA family protein [Candidatus Frankia alpina]|uniref:CapA family protein n=1 Tax=Candidatus Frankia alpina TaxID=2699483 RepID=A0A4S5ETE6_9ACTN|nr:CapA family protein [Candidatus Frankia alpina]THJ75714.1 CapA family protein [Candidatus Frankia alpina]